MTNWYLLDEPAPRPGIENMACDQHLLEMVEDGHLQAPILRLYRWERPTLSLGYHQRWKDTVDQAALTHYGIDLVRRWTGGRGVLHEPEEITYSLIAPIKDPFKARVTYNYRLIGTALERFTLLERARGTMSDAVDDGPSVRAQRGLPCFASISQSEIEASGQKLIGSAQKLGKNAFLQHGSIPMTHRYDVLQKITGTLQDVSGTMTGIHDLYAEAGQQIPSLEDLSHRLISAFEDTFQVQFESLPKGLPDSQRIKAIAETRFASNDWTFRK